MPSVRGPNVEISRLRYLVDPTATMMPTKRLSIAVDMTTLQNAMHYAV